MNEPDSQNQSHVLSRKKEEEWDQEQGRAKDES